MTPVRDDGLGDVLDVAADGCFGPALVMLALACFAWWSRA